LFVPGHLIGAAAAVAHDGQLGRAGASGLHCVAVSAMFGILNLYPYKTMPQKLTRAQIKAGFDQVPIETLLSSGEGKTPKLTHKMKAFAHAVALGESKANAYRRSHKANPAPSTIKNAPYVLAADARIQREIEAYKLAIEAEKHRTPAQLKALLVQQLVEHTLNEDFPPAQRMKALHMIGTLFEVGAFLERKESTVIHKSADIRTRLLERLQTRTHTEPASDALELLQEIREGSGISVGDVSAPTGGAPAHEGLAPPSAHTHTVPNIQSSEKNEGGGPSEITDVVSDFDKE
jgi:hypothetical protein